MFDKLKSTISTLVSSTSNRVLKESEVDKLLWEFEVSLLESEVAYEVVERLVSKAKNDVVGHTIQRSADLPLLLKERLMKEVQGVFSNTNKKNVIKSIGESKLRGEPYTILFLGINGTGKTTSIAKTAKMLNDKGLSVVMAGGDTHRAGAIEQLSQHAKHLSIKMVAQNYGADPAAVARDGLLYAISHKIDVVLIDTAGRMQVNKNLMDELSKIIRVVNPDLKIFVGDALAGNDTVSQAKEFMAYTDFDGAILTKVDADVKGGAALSLTYITGKPILFLGVGQGYDDLIAFDHESFISSLFSN